MSKANDRLQVAQGGMAGVRAVLEDAQKGATLSAEAAPGATQYFGEKEARAAPADEDSVGSSTAASSVRPLTWTSIVPEASELPPGPFWTGQGSGIGKKIQKTVPLLEGQPGQKNYDRRICQRIS